MLTAMFLLGAGIGILVAGGHFLVDGAVRLALLARLRPGIVGLTVVALGTSMPELAVSVGAALEGATDVAYSNVVGSNIFNIAVVLGATALLRAIPVVGRTARVEYPLMLLALAVQLLVVRDGHVDRLEGAFFVAGLVVVLAFLVALARTDPPDETAVAAQQDLSRHAADAWVRRWGPNLLRVAVGLAGLAGGAEMMVRGAVALAEVGGISQRVIGLTIVATGTSLPELATSLVAARKGQSELAIGNIVGSNLFNTLGILGVTATIVPVPVHPAAIRVDNWVMLLAAAALFPFMRTRLRIGRPEGALLVTGFVIYVTWLVITG